jgi:hypothetical protein
VVEGTVSVFTQDGTACTRGVPLRFTPLLCLKRCQACDQMAFLSGRPLILHLSHFMTPCPWQHDPRPLPLPHLIRCEPAGAPWHAVQRTRELVAAPIKYGCEPTIYCIL